MANENVGRVVWRELLTSDLDKAKGFFGELFGWKFQVMEMPDGPYTIIQLGETGIGGMMTPPGEPMPSMWGSYVAIDDADATAKRIEAGGGNLMMPVMEIPDVGRLFMAQDFAGAFFAGLQPKSDDAMVPDRPPVGSFCWESITTNDLVKAKQFYGEVFGWKAEPGAGGVDVFKTEAGAMVADVSPVQGGMPPSWLTYVVVEKLSSSNERVTKLGGQVLMPRIDVAGIGHISVIKDPSGAVLGLFEPEAG